MPLNIPCRHNPTLQAVLERVNRDEELEQLWRCVNMNAVDRSKMSDHGEVHVRIVANIALRLLRLLNEAEIEMSVVKDYSLTVEDAEVIVVGFGIVARVLRSAVEAVRREGIRAGLLRPITLWPFPEGKLQELADPADAQ